MYTFCNSTAASVFSLCVRVGRAVLSSNIEGHLATAVPLFTCSPHASLDAAPARREGARGLHTQGPPRVPREQGMPLGAASAHRGESHERQAGAPRAHQSRRAGGPCQEATRGAAAARGGARVGAGSWEGGKVQPRVYRTASPGGAQDEGEEQSPSGREGA